MFGETTKTHPSAGASGLWKNMPPLYKPARHLVVGRLSPPCRAAPPSGRVAPCCPPRQTAGVRLCNHTLIGLADLRGSRPRVQVRGLSEGAQARSSACYQLARSSRLWETAIETASHSHSLACNTGHRPHLACTTSIGPELSHHPCSRLFSHVRSSLTHLDHQCRIGSSSGR